MHTKYVNKHELNPLLPEFFFFVIFRDIAYDKLFSSTDS